MDGGAHVVPARDKAADVHDSTAIGAPNPNPEGRGRLTRSAARRLREQQPNMEDTAWTTAVPMDHHHISDVAAAPLRCELPLSHRRRSRKRRSSDMTDGVMDDEVATTVGGGEHGDESSMMQMEEGDNLCRAAAAAVAERKDGGGEEVEGAESKKPDSLPQKRRRNPARGARPQQHVFDEMTMSMDDGGEECSVRTPAPQANPAAHKGRRRSRRAHNDARHDDLMGRTQVVMEKGQFVAVAADSDRDPFWLARLMEPIVAVPDKTSTVPETTTTTSTKGNCGEMIPIKHEEEEAIMEQKEGAQRTEGLVTEAPSARRHKRGEVNDHHVNAMVKVIWLEPHQPNNAAPSSFEEFSDGAEGIIPIESVICQVSPQATKRGLWKLDRRDKLRIFRIRVDRPGPPIEWITSHLLPDRIIWSSHPHLIKPDIAFNFSAEELLLQLSDDETLVERCDSDAAGSTCTQTQSQSSSTCSSEDRTSQGDANADKQSEKIGSPSTLQLGPNLSLSPRTSDHDAAKLKLFKRAAQLLRDAQAILVMAGAGMGKDSGLPDYRGAQGFWRSYPPLAKQGITFSESMDPSWFMKDPLQAWGFYGHRAKLYAETGPHRGFEVLRQLGQAKGLDNFFIVTSNIDEQFQKAGFDESHIYECHGSLGNLQCVKPCSSSIWRLTPEAIPMVDMETLRVLCTAKDTLPKCQLCGNLARPNVSMAGDTQDTWVENRSLDQKKRLVQWLKKVMRGADDLPISQDDVGPEGEMNTHLLRAADPDNRHRSAFAEYHEHHEILDEWREIPVKRKRRSTGKGSENSSRQPQSSGLVPDDFGQGQEPSSAALPKHRPRTKPKLVIVELGCGDSLHSLRIEAELMIRENPSARLIRINPNFSGTVKRGHLALKMGALEALMGIGDRLLQQEQRGKVKHSKETLLAGDVQIAKREPWSSSPDARGECTIRLPNPTVLGPPL